MQLVVLGAASAWNEAFGEARLRYTGACSEAFAVAGNGINEISIVQTVGLHQSELGLTQSRIQLPGSGFAHPSIVEADITLSPSLIPVPVCLDAAVIHELGHLLGLEHSESASDVMFPTIVLNDPTTCNTTLSDEDIARLDEIYDVK